MKLIADTYIELPFKLDFCAKGPNVEPLTCRLDDTDAALYFPPSLSEGTDGQGFFGEWAWWTGKALRLIMEREIESADDVDTLRKTALATANEIIRRFLNAYRWRLGHADIHPIRIDPRTLTLEVIDNDGGRYSLGEPVADFFYQNMPDSPPLESSINETTLEQLQADVRNAAAPPISELLRLDAEALELQGELEHAALLLKLSANAH